MSVCALRVVHPVARPIINAQFADAFTDGPYIAGISECQTPDSCSDSRFRLGISKRPQPFRESLSLPNFDHRSIVAHGLQ